MNDRLQKARTLVSEALASVEAELATPRCGLCHEQLGTCRSTLRGYLAALESDALPPRKERGEPLGRLVHDAWPYDLPLGHAVVKAERAFRTV